jgi:hypothetical protein
VKATNKAMADAFRLMCRYSMSIMVDAEAKEVAAIFYGGVMAKEPCTTSTEAISASIRAIHRCAEMADKKIKDTP